MFLRSSIFKLSIGSILITIVSPPLLLPLPGSFFFIGSKGIIPQASFFCGSCRSNNPMLEIEFEKRSLANDLLSDRLLKSREISRIGSIILCLTSLFLSLVTNFSFSLLSSCFDISLTWSCLFSIK